MEVLNETIFAGTDLTFLTVIFLAVIAFGTSMLSAIIGMAGGIVLLGFMLLFLEPIDAIPLHGAIQLASNSSRAVVQRKHLAWPLIWRYSILLLPAGVLGLWIVLDTPSAVLKAMIAVFVLIATWKREWLRWGKPETIAVNRRFLLLGAFAGFLNILVGAVGPMIAPFFLQIGLKRQGIVGTKAACQTLGHLVKLVLFGLAGFAFGAYVWVFGLMVPMVILGTWVGSKLLDRVNEQAFLWTYRIALTAVASWLLVQVAFVE